MLTGALIGLIVGVVMVVATAAKQKKGGKAIASALAHGGAEGRRELDKYVKPETGKIGVGKIVQMQERFAWLAILGAYDDLEREAKAVQGQVTTIGQLRGLAAVGLMAHRDETRDLELLKETAAYVEAEGSALIKLVKKLLHDLVTVASVREGKPLDFDAMKRIYERATKSPPAVKIVHLRFLAKLSNDANFQRQADEAYAALRGKPN